MSKYASESHYHEGGFDSVKEENAVKDFKRYSDDFCPILNFQNPFDRDSENDVISCSSGKMEKSEHRKFSMQMEKDFTFNKLFEEVSTKEGYEKIVCHPVIKPENVNIESKIKKPRNKKRFFDPLVKFLSTFFQTLELNTLESLPEFHLKLFHTILKRKFNLKEESNLTLRPSSEILRQIIQHNRFKSSKRTEENNKFVFKHSIKIMKNDIKEKLNRQMSNAELDQLFFEEYFSAENTEDAHFNLVNPEFRKGLINSKASSLSISGLRDVCRSKKFMNRFIKIIGDSSDSKSEFILSYLNSIEKKIVKLFKKWERSYKRSTCLKEFEKQIHLYFQRNNQCKLPWTIEEISIAVKCVLKTIEGL